MATKEMTASPSLTVLQLTTDDLDACLDVVESYWTQIKEYTSRTRLTSDDLETLFHYFEQLVEIVALDLANAHGRARLLQCLEKKEIFNQYFAWLLKLTDTTGRLKEHLLASIHPLCRPVTLLSVVLPDSHLCQFIVSAIDYAISANKQQQLRVPLDSVHFLLGQICLAISKAIAADQDLFLAVYSNRCALLPAYRDYLARNSRGDANDPTRFPIITAMLTVALMAGEAGDLGREAIVLLVDAVRQQGRTDIAVFLAENTDLCPVLATGLSGLFSTLPRVLAPDANSVLFSPSMFDDFFDKQEPVLFVDCFRFVNRVVTLAHPAIRDRLVDFLYHGFLVPVLAPALNQPVGDELITTIVYLDYLCLQNLSDAHVASAFVKFLLSASYDGMATIDTLIKYLDLPSSAKAISPPRTSATASPSPSSSSSSSAPTSSYWRLLFCALCMFHSFLSLRSHQAVEEVFYELIHRHLSNLTYLMRSQRLQLVGVTKARLKSLCILCSLHPHVVVTNQVAQETTTGSSEKPVDVLPNAFYKRGADHYLSLVTLDNNASSKDSQRKQSISAISATIIRSLEDTPVGRQLLSDYTALLEEAPFRLMIIDRLTSEWRRCGTINSMTAGICPVHRQLLLNRDDDEAKTLEFFEADVWSESLPSEDGDGGTTSTTTDSGALDVAEHELEEFVHALSESETNVEERLEKLDTIDLSELIPTAIPDVPFAANGATATTNGQRLYSESFSQSSAVNQKISVGPFLTRLFELVDHFAELPPPVVVALGTLISHLASIPHPLLAPLLLDPKLNVHPNVKSLPIVLSAVRERFIDKISSEGYSPSDLRDALYAACQNISTGESHFADQMRHWSPSTSPLPTDENHFSLPDGQSSTANKPAIPEPPGSPRSFFSRLLRNGPRVVANNAVINKAVKNDPPPMKHQTSSNQSHANNKSIDGQTISSSSSSEFELTPRGGTAQRDGRGGSSGGNNERLPKLCQTLVLYNATLLELAAISQSASRRFF